VSSKLQVFRGDQAGEEFELSTPQTVIGRGDNCGIRFRDQSVSRVHAQVLRENGNHFVEDLGGRNGTYLNGELLVGKAQLKEGDRITIPGITLVFHSSASESAEPREDEGMTMTIVGSLDAYDSIAFITEGSAERQLQAMLQVLQALGGTLDLETLLDAMLAALLGVFPHADRGLVLLLENGRLIPKAHRHRSANSDSISYSRTIVQRAIERREATLMLDGGQDLISQSILFSGMRSAMCVPLFSRDKQPLGVLQVDASRLRKAFDNEDLHVLTCVAAQVSMAIEHAQLAHLVWDLRLAEEVQQGFLPQTVAETNEYLYWGHCQAARQVGGDFYDFFPLPNGSYAALLGDVAGKGLAAALMMAKAATVCKMALRSEPEDVPAVMRWVNREIHHSARQNQFVTCVLCVVRPETHEVAMASAGHMSPVICRSDGSTCTPLSTTMNGLPLGILEESEYEAVRIQLEPGECTVLYSDGISEAEDSQGRMYTTERISERLVGMQGKHPTAIGRALLDDVQQYVGDQEQSDDISIVVFGRKENSEP
jgi:serine phosphatase RsbU (regulator of sigma subunit)